MSRFSSLLSVSVLLGTAIAPSTAFGSLVISQWNLSTGVIGPNNQDGHGFYAVENPFVASHSAALGLSTAATSYAFSWSDTDGSFLIEGAHEAEDMGGLIQSLSSGTIRFTTTQDLLFTVDAAYAYDLPAYGMSAYIDLTILDRPPTQWFFNTYRFLATWDAWPQTGTLAFQGQAVLPAGREYSLSYKMETDTRGTTGQIATSSGHLFFTFSPVPEPSTAALTALASVLLLERRRRIRSS